jgi:hypothetical protein
MQLVISDKLFVLAQSLSLIAHRLAAWRIIPPSTKKVLPVE